MDSAALAAFVREELPRYLADVAGAKGNDPYIIDDFIAALDAALGLLREAEQTIAYHHSIHRRPAQNKTCAMCQLLTTLSLVVGEKEAL